MNSVYANVNHAYIGEIFGLLKQSHPSPTVRDEAMSKESIGVQFTVTDAHHPVITLPGRKLNHRLMVAEALWNLVPLSYDFMRKFNKRADEFVSDQPTDERLYARWHYGQILRYEIPRVVAELRHGAFTRRAVYTLPQCNLSVAVGTPPCLLGQQFLYRDGALHCITTMRSNDIFLGTPLDFFQFMLFQHLVAAGAGLPVGTFTLQAASLHLYERDLEKVEAILTPPRPMPSPLRLNVNKAMYRDFENGSLHAALFDFMHNHRRSGLRHLTAWDTLLNVLEGDEYPWTW